MTEAEFRAQLAAQGYDEPTVAEREANFATTEHTHEFSASALILEGEVNVMTATGKTTCHAGDTFMLASGIPHHEEYGAQGARFLVGRRVP